MSCAQQIEEKGTTADKTARRVGRERQVSVGDQLAEERAALEATLKRAEALGKKVELLGRTAANEAREAVDVKQPQRNALDGNTSALRDADEARKAAEEAARFTIENPEDAVRAQPYLGVQAALRVLS